MWDGELYSLGRFLLPSSPVFRLLEHLGSTDAQKGALKEWGLKTDSSGPIIL